MTGGGWRCWRARASWPVPGSASAGLRPLLMVPFAATFVTPVTTGTDAVIYGVIVGIATLYGVVVWPAASARPGRRRRPPRPARRRRSWRSCSARCLGGSAAIGVALGWTEPYWVPEPVLILVLYVIIGKRDRIRGKAIGTVLGVAAALPVALLDPSAGVLAAVGTVAFVVALTQAKTYWLMYGLYTFSLILLLGAPGQVASRPRSAASRSSSASASSSSVCSSFTRSAGDSRNVIHSLNSRRRASSREARPALAAAARGRDPRASNPGRAHADIAADVLGVARRDGAARAVATWDLQPPRAPIRPTRCSSRRRPQKGCQCRDRGRHGRHERPGPARPGGGHETSPGRCGAPAGAYRTASPPPAGFGRAARAAVDFGAATALLNEHL